MVLEDYPDSLFVRAAMDPAYADLRPEADPAATAPSPLDLRRYAWTEIILDADLRGIPVVQSGSFL